MEVTIPVFWIILLVILIHTILQHLINSLWRSVNSEDDFVVALVATVGEFALLLVVLISTLYV